VWPAIAAADTGDIPGIQFVTRENPTMTVSMAVTGCPTAGRRPERCAGAFGGRPEPVVRSGGRV